MGLQWRERKRERKRDGGYSGPLIVNFRLRVSAITSVYSVIGQS